MSNPSFSNIDLWLFELAEGNLSPVQVEQLEMFLLQHPELDVDRDVWESAKVDATPPVFEQKEELRRRAPIAWYSAAGAAAVLCLIGITSTFVNTSSQQKTLSAEEVRTNRINAKLTEELQVLKAKLSSFESTQEASIKPNNEHKVNTLIVTNASAKGFKGKQELTNSDRNNLSNLNGLNKNLTILNNGNKYAQITDNSDHVALNVQDLSIKSITPIQTEKDFTLETYLERTAELTMNADLSYFENEVNSVPEEKREFGSDYGDYQLTLKGRINNFSRAIQRMMDNPVALKNYRDPHYHVPGMLPNDVNFSSTGALLTTRVQAMSRLQWYGEENQQLMNQIAIDGYAYSMRGGVGVQLNHQMYNDGSVNVADVAVTYSPKISITKTISFEPAVRFKMGNMSLNRTKMNAINAIEMERANVHEFYPGEQAPLGNDLWYKDLGLGMMINTEWFFIGVQVDNIFRHTENIYSNDLVNPRRASNHFVGTVGTDWVSSNKNVSLSPYLVYQNKEKLSEAWLGANLRLSKFTFGASVSSSLEPAASIGLKFDRVAIQYNADYLKSVMTSNQSLSHQITVRFTAKPNRFGKRILNL